MATQPNPAPVAPAPKVVKAEKPTFVLPTEKNKPKDKICDYKWLIYGPPGIGKTTLASQFDTPLILDFEQGSNHLECYRVPIGCYEDIENLYGALKATKHEFKTLVFDTVDLFYRLCQTEVCDKRKIEHPSDEAWGKGSDMVKNKVYRMVAAFQALGLGIVFISHVADREIKTRTVTYTKTGPSLSKAPSDIFVPLCDIVGYCHLDEETQSKRLITFKGTDYIDAKARTSEVVSLPEQCALDYSVIKSFFKGEKAGE